MTEDTEGTESFAPGLSEEERDRLRRLGDKAWALDEALAAQRDVDDARADQLQAEARAKRIVHERESAWLKPEFGSLGVSASEFLTSVPDEIDWVIPTVVARGGSALLAGSPKVGKGVFTAYVVGCAERGEATVFGPAPIGPDGDPLRTRTYVVTEEPPDSFREKVVSADLRDAVIVGNHQLLGMPWELKAEFLVGDAQHSGCGMIWIDHLARTTGITGAEENDITLGQMVGRFGDLARSAGITVLLNHHLRKTEGNVFERIRGGTGLPAAVDVLIGMEFVGEPTDRKRRLTAMGRHSANQWCIGVELAEDPTDGYRLADVPQARNGELRKQARADDALSATAVHLAEMGSCTAKEYADRWGGSPKTAARYLEKLEQKGGATSEADRTRPGTPIVWTHSALDT